MRCQAAVIAAAHGQVAWIFRADLTADFEGSPPLLSWPVNLFVLLS